MKHIKRIARDGGIYWLIDIGAPHRENLPALITQMGNVVWCDSRGIVEKRLSAKPKVMA